MESNQSNASEFLGDLLQKATQNVVLSDSISSNQLLNNLDELYQYIKSVHQNKITPLNIVMITSELIQVVEKYNSLTGQQKKMLIINVIKKIINENNYTSDEKLVLNSIIDNTLPNMIDGFISAINGMMKFSKNIKKSKCSKFFLCK